MEALPRRIDLFVNPASAVGDREAALASVKDSVSRGDVTMRGLVAAMGDYLTSTREQIRAQAVRLVVEALGVAPRQSTANCETFSRFFGSKVSDYACVEEALRGLEALTLKHDLRGEALLSAAQAALTQTTVQSLPQGSRMRVYVMAERGLGALPAGGDEKKRDEMKKRANVFAQSFVDAMDGEKDPRCLLSCFRVAEFLGRALSPSAMDAKVAEDLFDVTTCYFPITFKAPKDDPFGIRGEDLKDALTAVVTSTPQFAKLSFDLLFERFDEGPDDSTCVDVFTAACRCVRAYGAGISAAFLPTLWKHTRDSLTVSSSKDVQDAAATALTSIVATLLPDTVGGFAVSGVRNLPDLAKDIFSACGKQVNAAAAAGTGNLNIKLLTAVASASGAAFAGFLKACSPIIQSQVQSDETTPTHKAALARALAEILLTFRSMGAPVVDDTVCVWMAETRSLLMACAQGGYAEQRAAAATGLAETIVIDRIIQNKNSADDRAVLLSPEQAASIATTLTQIALFDENKKARVESLDALVTVAGADADLTSRTAVRVLVDAAAGKEIKKSAGRLRLDAQALRLALRRLASTSTAMVAGATRPLLGAAVAVLEWEGGSTADTAAQLIATAAEIIDASNVKKAAAGSAGDSAEKVLVDVSGLLVATSSSTFDKEGTAKVVAAAGTLARAAGNLGSLREQKEFFGRALPSLLRDSVLTQKPPLSGSARTATMQRAALTCELLSAARPDILTEILNSKNVFFGGIGPFLMNIPPAAGDEPVYQMALQAAMRCAATVINKLKTVSEISTWVTRSGRTSSETFELVEFRGLGFRGLWTVVDEGSRPTWQRVRAVTLIAYLTMGLAARGDRAATQATQRLAAWTCSKCETVADAAVEGFAVIASGANGALSAATHCSVKRIFRQKFFMQASAALLAPAATAGEGDSKTQPWRADAALLIMVPHLPDAVVRQQTAAVTRCAVRGLMSSQPKLCRAALGALRRVLPTAVTSQISTVKSHLRALVESFIKISAEGSAREDRAAAILCLEALSLLPYESIHRFKKAVINGLARALDDPKRVVRRAAVRCRNEWYVTEGLV